uniref:Aminopeptidase n=1 Tax=viral metagenome TaxID=1070528 RepID=A0A6C0DZW0_9ZZZZ
MNSDYVKELYSTSNDNLIANACLSTNIKRLFINHKNIERINHIFSKEINTMKIINQKNTGTCWICSGITICRNILRKTMKTKDDFNLSINHYMFWDKMEKANNFIDYIISNNKLGLENEKIIDRIQDPISDGGYWYMFADLVNKYGIVPESVNTRGYNGTNTTVVNELISYKLREFALQIMENNNHEYEELKKEYLGQVKKILCMMFGEPFYPDTKFTLTYKNKNDKKTVIDEMTPMSFYEDYLKVDLNDFVTISNDPRENNPYYKCYTKNDVYGYKLQKNNSINYIQLNLPNDEIKKLLIRQLDDGIPVWFSNDITKHTDNESNIMDTNIFEHQILFNIDKNTMTKAQELNFRNANPCHAMTITGYDVRGNDTKKRKREEEKYLELTKFKVENSWGTTGKNEGIYAMTIQWMENYAYEFIINIKYLTAGQKKALYTKPVILPDSDPMCKMLN